MAQMGWDSCWVCLSPWAQGGLRQWCCTDCAGTWVWGPCTLDVANMPQCRVGENHIESQVLRRECEWALSPSVCADPAVFREYSGHKCCPAHQRVHRREGVSHLENFYFVVNKRPDTSFWSFYSRYKNGNIHPCGWGAVRYNKLNGLWLGMSQFIGCSTAYHSKKLGWLLPSML